MKRERLNVTEVELFKAVDRWAEKNVRQGIAPERDGRGEFWEKRS